MVEDNNKSSVRFNLKGRGVSENPKERTLDLHNSDSYELSPFLSKTEGVIMEKDTSGSSTCTDANYTWIRPSVNGNGTRPEVRANDTDVSGANDASVMYISANHTFTIGKDTTVTCIYVSLKDTDVVDPLKDPDALDSLKFIGDTKVLDTKSLGRCVDRNRR
jgi:hypothetical protein